MKRFRHTLKFRETAAYTASSMLATVLDYLIYLLVLTLMHRHGVENGWILTIPWLGTLRFTELNLAYTIARLCSAVENFYFNNYLVFHQPSDGHLIFRLAKYMLVAVMVAVIGNLILNLFHEQCHIPALIAKVMTDLTTFLLSYLAQKYFVFRTKNRKDEQPVTETDDNHQ